MSNNPYDSGQEFGIDHEDQFIPFNTEGSTVFFNYSVTMDADINTCPHIVLTDNELEWDPYGVEMASKTPYGENTARVNYITAGDKRRQVEV